jgi:hypothetical protein
MDGSSKSTTTFYIYRVGGLAFQTTLYNSESSQNPNSTQTQGDPVRPPLGAVRPPGGLVSDWLQGTPIRPSWGPSLTDLPNLSQLLPNLSVNTCRPLFK